MRACGFSSWRGSRLQPGKVQAVGRGGGRGGCYLLPGMSQVRVPCTGLCVCVCPESQLCFEALGVLLPPLACLCSASGGKANAAGRVWGCGMSLGQRGTGFLLGVNTGCASAPMSRPAFRLNEVGCGNSCLGLGCNICRGRW